VELKKKRWSCILPKSNKVRQAELKARCEAEGKVKRPYWATPEEHEAVKARLAELRNKQL